MQSASFDLSCASQDEIWAIWRGELQVEMTPEDETRLYAYCGQEFYTYVQACENEEELAKYRADLRYDPASGVDEQLCLDAYISLYEERRLSVIEADFPHFLKHIREEYAAVSHEQDFQDFLADYWDFCTAPEPNTLTQDMDALWDQIAAAHNATENVAFASYAVDPQVKTVWVKLPPYAEVKTKTKVSAWDFSGNVWHEVESPKYQLVM